MCEILSRSNLAARSYGTDTDLGYVCTVTLTLGQGQQLCEILSRSNFERMSYGLNTDFWYMGTETLTLGQGENNCMKYYPDPILQ